MNNLKQQLEASLIVCLLTRKPFEIFNKLELDKQENQKFFMDLFLDCCFQSGYIRRRIEEKQNVK